MSEPYTRAAMVSVPAELVEALRALADEMEDPNAERGTMPGVRMHVRRVWAARLRTVLGAFAARALVDAAERPDEGEDECAECGNTGGYHSLRCSHRAVITRVAAPLVACPKCGHDVDSPDGCSECPAPLSPSVRRTRDEGTEDEAAWQRISDDLPESFWKVATWDDTENWSPGSLDVADRKRIGLAIIKAMQEDKP